MERVSGDSGAIASSTGDYQDSFSDLVSGAVELTIDSQPNLERECKERLPDRVLSYLKNQIREIEMQQNG